MRKKLLSFFIFTSLATAACSMYAPTDDVDPSVTAHDKERMGEEDYKEIIGKMEKMDLSKIDLLKIGSKVTLVYVGNIECPYCRRYAPKIDRELLDKGYSIYHVDLQDEEVRLYEQKLVEEYGVSGTPTLLAIGYGQVEEISVPGEGLTERTDEVIEKMSRKGE